MRKTSGTIEVYIHSKFSFFLAELPRYMYFPSFPVSWRNYWGTYAFQVFLSLGGATEAYIICIHSKLRLFLGGTTEASSFSRFLAELPRHLVFLFLGGTTEVIYPFRVFLFLGGTTKAIYTFLFSCVLALAFKGSLMYGKHSQHTRPSLFGICQQLACASWKIMPTCTQRLHKTKCIY